MTISAVLIVRDEEANLAQCLRALQGVADEIIIVDTGSNDGTCEIARRFTPNVFSYAWDDDFAAARNEALTHATCDYVLSIDADEVLINSVRSRGQLESFMSANSGDTVGTVIIESQIGDCDDGHTADALPRFFRCDGFFYRGAIHEQLTPLSGSMAFAPTELRFHHGGYALGPDAAQAKAARNTRLLLRELDRQPNSPYYRYQLAKAYFSVEEYDQAAGAFEDALEHMAFAPGEAVIGADDLTVDPTVFVDCIVTLAYTYARLGEFGAAHTLLEAHDRGGHARGHFADFPHVRGYINLMMGSIAESKSAFEEALALGIGKEIVCGTGGHQSWYHLGLLAEAEQDLARASECYMNALQLDPTHGPTLNRIIDCVIEYGVPLPEATRDVHPSEALSHRLAERTRSYVEQGHGQHAKRILLETRRLSDGLYRELAGRLTHA